MLNVKADHSEALADHWWSVDHSLRNTEVKDWAVFSKWDVFHIFTALKMLKQTKNEQIIYNFGDLRIFKICFDSDLTLNIMLPHHSEVTTQNWRVKYENI